MTLIPTNSAGSGLPTHSAEAASGKPSDDSRRLSSSESLQNILLRAASDSPRSSVIKEPNRSTCHTQPHGSATEAGSQLTTRSTKLSVPLPATKQDRRQRNLQNEQWRRGFGDLMIATSSAFNRRFGRIDLDLWSQALAEHDLIDLAQAFVAFLKSPEGFPTPGKAEVFIKRARQQRLGLIVR